MKYKIYKNNSQQYYGYTYAVLVMNEKENPIVYFYKSQDKTNEVLKPWTYSVIIDDNFKPDNINEALRKVVGYSNSDYKEIKGTLEDYSLYIPERYKEKELEVIEQKNSELSDETVNKIKKIKFSYPIVILNDDVETLSNTKWKNYQYFCTKCNKKYVIKDSNRINCCPNCDNKTNDTIVMKDFKKFREQQYNKKYYYGETFSGTNSAVKVRFYLLSKHPENEDGIIIYKISREVVAEKSKIFYNYNIEYSIEHIVGKKMIAYKHLKRSKKECDPFEALNLTTKNINNPPEILYDDADNFLEFAEKNEKFLRMSGFQSVLKYSSINLNLESFFIVFIGIMNKYPIMEQIVKMGHAKLFFKLYISMLESLNKDEITRNINNISQIVNTETTKGKNALRFPSYIGDYLIKKDAKLEEYYYWRDIYEITNLSKEQFENLLDSFNFAWINSQAGLQDICNILKFNYPIDKLFNYIMKQSKQANCKIPDIIQYLTDYLNMCDILQVEADKYPHDLIKIHNDMLVHFKNKQRADYDKKLSIIGNECEKYIVPDEQELDNIGIPKLFETMCVVFPKCERDFIDEGNQQHNCVGSYPNRVRNGNCVVFFIRYKENSNKSFITAECTRTGLGQCFYSNNRPVYDDNLNKFATYIAKKIKAGVKSGKIHALENVDN